MGLKPVMYQYHSDMKQARRDDDAQEAASKKGLTATTSCLSNQCNTIMVALRGYLGIDNGTQGLSIVFTDENNHNILATGEGSYDMVDLERDGCYEQRTQDWENAMVKAMNEIHDQFSQEIQILGIGVSGQMHGEVLCDEYGETIGNVRLWCDARNEEEGRELTALFRQKIPKRSTCARFLWTARNDPEKAAKTHHMTTPAGWIHYKLTGEWTLGIGDASGMFPIDQSTLDYDQGLVKDFDSLINSSSIPSIQSLLPKVCVAGEDAGYLNAAGARLLGLPETGGRIPVAAAEGDQPAALAGSLIAEAGMVSMSFGTSTVANAVGDRPFQGVHDGVDQFCGADGKPINMIWIRNGTTYLNAMAQMYASILQGEDKNGFEVLMPLMLEADADCGGLIALPFMDDEPGVGVSQGGTATIIGWSRENATPGNVAKAALLAPIFNLKLGTLVLKEQGYPQTEIILSGGLTKTPECGQILADVFDMPVQILAGGNEGSAWGAAVLAAYRHLHPGSVRMTWTSFCSSLQSKLHGAAERFLPNSKAVKEYQEVFGKYKQLMQVQPLLSQVMNPPDNLVL